MSLDKDQVERILSQDDNFKKKFGKINPIFYCSSRGSSASQWLAKVLSRHPNIVAFSGTRSIPPYGSGTKDKQGKTNDIGVQKFIEGLHQCHLFTYGEKIFGGIHGYYGICAKIECENYGGLFSYITRNPVTRISSYLEHTVNEIFNKQQKRNIPIENIMQHMSGNGSGLIYHDIMKIFRNGCQSFFHYERELFDNCGPDKGFRMEDMVSDINYFRQKVWPLLIKGLDPDDKYLKSIFQIGRINKHRKKRLAASEIWNSWPLPFKSMFLEIYTHYQIQEIAESFEYDMSVLYK